MITLNLPKTIVHRLVKNFSPFLWNSKVHYHKHNSQSQPALWPHASVFFRIHCSLIILIVDTVKSETFSASLSRGQVLASELFLASQHKFGKRQRVCGCSCVLGGRTTDCNSDPAIKHIHFTILISGFGLGQIYSPVF
jgi:hypothetical protein